jgi:hypothetical protein
MSDRAMVPTDFSFTLHPERWNECADVAGQTDEGTVKMTPLHRPVPAAVTEEFASPENSCGNQTNYR